MRENERLERGEVRGSLAPRQKRSIAFVLKMETELSFSLLLAVLGTTVNGFSLCKDPELFTWSQAIELQCEGVNEVTCWNILGFKWNDDDNICQTEFWTRSTPDIVTACTSAGGTPQETQTCGDHKETFLTYLTDNNISTEVPLTTETCATLLSGDTLGLEGSLYTFIHATTVCCGGQPHLGACDPDEQAICADTGFYTPDRFLRMRCYGVNQTTCEDALPGFSWEIDRQGGHEVCTGPAAGQMACETAMGFTSPQLTCAELNTIYSLLETRYQLDFETQEGCDAFFVNVSSEFGSMDDVNPLLTNSFLNYVGAPLCCDGMPTVCTSEDPYSVCADPDDFVPENPARLECHGLTLDECLGLDGFEYDDKESTCLTELFMEANEGYEDACMDIGGFPVAPSTCAETQAYLTSYFTEMSLNGFNNETCQDLLSEVDDPFTALYWFEHLPTACCGSTTSTCEFEPIDLCAEPDQFTPNATARLRCLGISVEQCGALEVRGYQVDDDGVCKTRVFEPISVDAESDCMNIGGIPKVEATCELTQTVATYLLGEHRIYNLSVHGQCQNAVDSLDGDDAYASYLFRHVPVVCCGGEENAICSADDVDDTCENQILFYEASELATCGNPLATNFTDSTCDDGCLENVQSLVDDLGCCAIDWIEAAYAGADIPTSTIWDRILQVCSADTTSIDTCDEGVNPGTPTPAPVPAPVLPDSGAPSFTKISVFTMLTAVAAAMSAQQ